MNFNIIRTKDFQNGKTWILAELNLYDYVTSLDTKNFDFSIQRKIVKNKYLDSILTTVEAGEPLPAITLAYKEKIDNETLTKKILKVDNEQFEILDGLQRTYRLWAFWKIISMIKSSSKNSLKDIILEVKAKHPDFFDQGIVDSKFFKDNFPDGKVEKDFEDIYKSFNLYFAIWSNLTEFELVKKMLILNAGHKAVSTQHQFEILFLSLWKKLAPILKKKEITIAREKDERFNTIKKGDRRVGEFLFSTIITSLMSLVLAKPQRISSDAIYKYDLLNEDDKTTLNFAEVIFDSDYISTLMENLLSVDIEVERQYDKKGLAWFGKDTTINGIFAGIGVYLNLAEKSEKSDPKVIKDEILEAIKKLKTNLPDSLQLDQFEQQYNNVSGRSVNIGNLIRSVVMSYTIHRLKDEKVTWSSLFSQEMGK